ncbi:YqaA family protein [Pseudoalteromonas denitrificans]|uniref:Membrane protein YqaA, SNARE-associated domain n=1 Tax=Pseudoalteromonas denitrificans DSM 6059 TaxID=1123010 RepID=A0A1I1MAR9_9GAMM|nr:YqaA family protein [Pseudoalteromonas denitrificans]SFC82265.1 membrane protein YqaA, SNARE-associated domain [Pseudoalteromonas denitrificans DSM 6059]
MIYFSLFLTSFIAATLFPAASEALLAALVTQDYGVFLLWISATLGNTLGSCVNWWLGKESLRFKEKKWFPVSDTQLKKSQMYFQRYGLLTLLFAWLPIVGDPLTLIAGVMRIRFGLFLILVFLGKGMRYAFVIWLATSIA